MGSRSPASGGAVEGVRVEGAVSEEAPKDPTVPTDVLSVGGAEQAPVGLRIKGRYCIAGEMGVGPFGAVYVADDEATGHRVALRLLPGGPAGSPLSLQGFQLRGRSLIAVSAAQPAFVQVLEVGETEGGLPFVATELVEGKRLSDVLAEGGPLEVGRALRIALDLGASLEPLHNLGLVHGALRPRNIVLLEDGRAKLMDLELAGLRDASGGSAGRATEPPPSEHLSPEQILRKPLTEKSDIYAFACTVYHMLCGAPPFQADTRKAVVAKDLAEAPAPMRRRRRAVPAALDAIVLRALAKRPEQRPPMQDILNDLWVEVNRAPARWKRTPMIAGAAVLAAALAAFAVGQRFGRHAPEAPPVTRAAAPAPAPAPIAEPTPALPPRVHTPAPVAQPARAEPAPVKAVAPRPPAPPALPARHEQPQPTRAPVSPAVVREAPAPRAAVAHEGPAPRNVYDPNAVVDWLLNRGSQGGQ